uniref:Late blight resistance protein homolog R1B-13 n=1 Tax=Nicotiana sylvestris TaxID=4096 RepID=A0A1U7WUX0_NICSY|nr:PREDICTED: putative late blight resistance protein homolog R1B-13 [Nicotiana sylvestris]
MCVVDEETEFGLGEMVSTLRLPYANAFPKYLKKLTLQKTFVPWEDITTVSKLPKLEVLKLKIYNCRGTVWETIEDGFPQLKFLLLDGTDVALWKTSSDHFPCLECLVLGNCDSLHSRFCRYNHTLQLIELNMCKHSVVNSAKQIQQEVGDNVLDVRVRNPIYPEEEEE